jgi:hypothetical protein
MEKSYMQLQAELAQFDADARFMDKIESKIPRVCPQPIPVKNPQLTTQISRDNPNADWAGRVPQANRRKVYNSHTAQKTSIISTDHGFVPSSDAQLSEHDAIKAKKHFENDQRFHGLNQNTPISNVYQSCPGGEHSAASWKTSYQAEIENNGGTQMEQYLPGKGLNRKGKKQLTPAYEYNARNGTHGGQMAATKSSNSYRGSRNSRSMLAGLGGLVLGDIN